jgi:[ribosomal protein S5]-alanine N-acetyltransferase
MVGLRPLVIADLPTVLQWSEDEAFCLANGWPLGLPRERLEDWFLRLLNNPPVDLIRQGILSNEQLVGFVDLRELNPLEKRARLRIAIGTAAFRGQGVGYAAGLNMLEYAFSSLGLGRITCEIAEDNLPMRSLVEKLGFTQEGVLRKHETRQGTKQNIYLFGMLQEEFFPRTPMRLPNPVDLVNLP